ncbi:MAG: hypothetical protein LBQ41_03180 [Candidatus Ancillula sp.]|nr:hypothetical protein [Candidatus Ancillula sp.]
MLSKIISGVLVIAGLLVMIFAITFSNNESATQNIVKAELAIDKASPTIVITDTGVLEAMNPSISAVVSTDFAASLNVAVGASYDVNAWIEQVNTINITGISPQGKLLLQNRDNLRDEVRGTSYLSDIWNFQNTQKNEAKVDWVRPNDNNYSIIFVITPDDTAFQSGTATITFSWLNKSNSAFLVTGVVISIFLFVSALLLVVLRRRQNKNGSHFGDVKRLKDIVVTKNKFSLPQTEQIQSVKDFMQNEKSAGTNSSSLLTTATLGQKHTASYFTSVLDGNTEQNATPESNAFQSNSLPIDSASLSFKTSRLIVEDENKTTRKQLRKRKDGSSSKWRKGRK